MLVKEFTEAKSSQGTIVRSKVEHMKITWMSMTLMEGA